MNKYLTNFLKSHIPFSRRTRLRDMSLIHPKFRSPRSSTLQFYSKVHNIGNYIPVFGIQQMLGSSLDVWNCHDKTIDWDLINESYEAVIVGGAGLLHACFHQFWIELSERCKLPIVIWGIGVCLPENESPKGVDREVVSAVFQRAIMANVRDELTAEFYRLSSKVDISACPSIFYLQNFRKKFLDIDPNFRRYDVLHSIHTSLINPQESQKIIHLIKKNKLSIFSTDNISRHTIGIEDIIDKYRQSRLVITTRLHGAIIAFGLEIPYLALSRDPKITSFYNMYKGGYLGASIEELAEMSLEMKPIEGNLQSNLSAVVQFGATAKAALNDVIVDKKFL